MNRFKDKDIWIVIIAAIAILSFIIVIVNQKKQEKLPVYKSDESVPILTQAAPTQKLDVDFTIYSDESAGFTVYVPDTWEKVIKSGYTTFIHKESGSSVQFQVFDYIPSINNDNAEGKSVDVSENGYTFVNFNKYANDRYELMYQDLGATTYDYIEEVYWNKDNVVRLYCIINDAYYQKMAPYYERIINSFTWKSGKYIPDGYFLTYFSDNFEICLPYEWPSSVQNGTLYVTNQEQTANITFTYAPISSPLSNMTAVDVTNSIKGTKMNFVLEAFENKGDTAYARANYNVNGTKWYCEYYVYDDGSYIYHLLIDYIPDTIDPELPSICSSHFRSFNKLPEVNVATPDEADIK